MIEWLKDLAWYWQLLISIGIIITIIGIIYWIYEEIQWSKAKVQETTGKYDGRDIDSKTTTNVSPVIGGKGGVALTSSIEIIYKTFWKIKGLAMHEDDSENLYRKCRKLKEGSSAKIYYKTRLGKGYRIVGIDMDNDGIYDNE